MSEAPDWIRVCLDDNQDGCCPVETGNDPEEWGRFFYVAESTTYVRADIHTTEIDALQARVAELEAGLADMQRKYVDANEARLDLMGVARKVAHAAELRGHYMQKPQDRNRIGDKQSPKSRAKTIWMRALRKAETTARDLLAKRTGDRT